MEKQKFECAKNLANLENCIDCIKNDVVLLIDIIKKYNNEDYETEIKGATERAEHLTYWLERIIEKF